MRYIQHVHVHVPCTCTCTHMAATMSGVNLKQTDSVNMVMFTNAQSSVADGKPCRGYS